MNKITLMQIVMIVLGLLLALFGNAFFAFLGAFLYVGGLSLRLLPLLFNFRSAEILEYTAENVTSAIENTLHCETVDVTLEAGKASRRNPQVEVLIDQNSTRAVTQWLVSNGKTPFDDAINPVTIAEDAGIHPNVVRTVLLRMRNEQHILIRE